MSAVSVATLQNISEVSVPDVSTAVKKCQFAVSRWLFLCMYGGHFVVVVIITPPPGPFLIEDWS
jgi:hypothetical protein